MREDGQRVCSVLGSTPGGGRILLWDDFEGVFKWGWVAGYGKGRTVFRVEDGYDGRYCLSLVNLRRSADGMIWVYAGRWIPGLCSGRVVVEGVFKVDELYPSDGLALEVLWHDGVQECRAGVRFDFWFGKVWYFGDGWYYDDTGAEVGELGGGSWQRVWMEVDVGSGGYVGCGVGGLVVDMERMLYGVWEKSGMEGCVVLVGLGQMSVGSQQFRVDDFVVRRVIEEGVV